MPNHDTAQPNTLYAAHAAVNDAVDDVVDDAAVDDVDAAEDDVSRQESGVTALHQSGIRACTDCIAPWLEI